MAKRLPQRKLNAMFRAYCDRQSVYYVSRKCGVSHVTVKKYMRENHWRKRYKEIKLKAEEKSDMSAAEVMAAHQEMHVDLLRKTQAALKKKRLTTRQVNAKMLDVFARTGSFLFEDAADRRPDQVIKIKFGQNVGFSGKEKGGPNRDKNKDS